MTRIAHISDLHLLEDNHQLRDAGARLRLSFLSFGRRLDAEERRKRLRTALWSYRASDAEHLVVTGDLTEDGTEAQFEALAEVFFDSGIDPREVTLVPGNHDAYTSADAFAQALQGPLAAFAATSASDALTELDDVVIVPISTVIFQPITRSAGVISEPSLQRARSMSERFRGGRRALAIAQHHQPYSYELPALNWIDGLQNHVSAMALLEQDPLLHVLHGHRHRSIDRPVASDGPARVFGANAVTNHARPMRLYEACDGKLWPMEAPGPAKPLAAVAHPSTLQPIAS
jgi:3',5'-cyclic AMP phosphodiesterase CpdA